MRFAASVIPSGNATAVEVPTAVMEALGGEGRPPVAITINGHSWRSRVAKMRGLCLIGISAAQRVAAGIAEGDMVEIDVTRDDAPREVSAPADLAEALNCFADARAAYDRLPFGLKRKRVAMIEDAKTPEVRRRRVEKLVADLRSG
ncbi:MAG: DUF1905 domain-containing protein [Sphingomonadaceae bacterium]|nr:DUF1905 domain-containing protein [Sphingomonadaceae bacterium]